MNKRYKDGLSEENFKTFLRVDIKTGEILIDCRSEVFAECKKLRRGKMKRDIDRRAVMVGEHIAETGNTVRSAAKLFGVSKSTVHYDATSRLKRVNPILAAKVKEVLRNNWNEKHIRGGLSTRKKYKDK